MIKIKVGNGVVSIFRLDQRGSRFQTFGAARTAQAGRVRSVATKKTSRGTPIACNGGANQLRNAVSVATVGIRKMRLANKVAIITGAGTGIGEAIAHKFAREGARLLLNGLADDPVQDVANAIMSAGGLAAVHLGDVSEENHAQACVELASTRLGSIDILVSNAGIFIANAATEDYRIEDFDRTVRNNIRTAFLMTKFTLPHLQASHGNIIYTGSEAGFNGSPRFTPYGGSKGFLHAFMKGVALEQAPYGVRANCVCPGAIDTAWTRGASSPIDQDAQARIGAMIPLGRRGTPEEIANIFAFLASDEASYVTGALWLADGGVTPAKADIGVQVPAELRRVPNGMLTLSHSHDGLRGKEVYRAVD